MLGALKGFLKAILIPILYVGSIITVIATIFVRADWGFSLLVVMIPQPNVWYKLHDYPFGNSFIDLLFFAVILGILYQKKGVEWTLNSTLITIFLIAGYFSLWNSSGRFSLPAPLSTQNRFLADWKNYAEMVFFYFIAINLLKEKDLQKKIIVIMAFIILVIAVRSYRNFSPGDVFNYEKRAGGPFEAVGLGANHFAAFISGYGAFLLGVFLFDGHKRRRMLFLAAVLFGLHPLFFSYSRGAYLATLAVIVFYGLIKKRSLLLLAFVILLSWQTLLPASVVDRITMTKGADGQLENSAGGRVLLWNIAYDLFEKNPLFGVGYGGYGMSVGGIRLDNGEVVPSGFDTHNFYLKTLCEQGLVGIGLLTLVFCSALYSGWRLYRIAEDPFYKGLGYGFMGCVLSFAITNVFGDRFSYFALGSYFWILWGMVDRCILNQKALLHSKQVNAVVSR